MDLKTKYLGFSLKHPLVASASPLSSSVAGVRRLEDANAAAIVLPSLFEEQIEKQDKILDHYMDFGTHSFAEALDYFPEPEEFKTGPDEYLKLVSEAKKAVDVPLFASLNGDSPGGWTNYAKLIEQAGADALELNLYHISTDSSMSSSDVEKMYLETVAEVRKQVSIPIAIKLSPFFTAFAYSAKELCKAGADGLVLFNRFYQPDFDLDGLEVVPHLVLSKSDELRLPLRWIAILYGQIETDFALTSGVHNHKDVLKGLMAGANITMMTSELLKKGVGRIDEILAKLTKWMEKRDYESVNQLQGSMSMKHVADDDAFERANYMKVLQSWKEDPTGKMF